MSRRATPRSGRSVEATGRIRDAFEPRYGRALDDTEIDEIADNLRRFHDVLASWDLGDKARALLDGTDTEANRAATPAPWSDDAT